MFRWISYEGGSLSNFRLQVDGDINFRGPVFCVLARICFVLNGVLSKYILMRKGYLDRLREKKLRKEIIQVRKKDVNEFGHLKKREVAKDSVICRRAFLYKNLNDKIIKEMFQGGGDNEKNIEKQRRRSSGESKKQRKKFEAKIRRLKRSSIDRLLKSK